MRLVGKTVRGVTEGNWSQQLTDEKRASGKELKGFEAPVRMERMSFFAVENALLMTVHQIIFL